MRTKTKKFKTAQGFLENCYDRECSWEHEKEGETKEAKIQRSRRAERIAIRTLLPAIGLQAKIDDDEDLKQAMLRIQQMPEAQNDRAQHFLKGAYKWLKAGRIVVLGSRVIGITTVGPADAKDVVP